MFQAKINQTKIQKKEQQQAIYKNTHQQQIQNKSKSKQIQGNTTANLRRLSPWLLDGVEDGPRLPVAVQPVLPLRTLVNGLDELALLALGRILRLRERVNFLLLLFVLLLVLLLLVLLFFLQLSLRTYPFFV